YPADDEDAAADLEAMRAQGAGFLVFPATGFWWFDHYAGFARMLRERYTALASTDDCVIFDLRAPVAPAVAAPPAAPAEDGATAPAPVLTPAEYAAAVERVRTLVESTIPAGAAVLVVSRGDEDLVTFDGRTGWHFPQSRDGRWLGYYPETDEEAIAHL